MTEDRQRSEDHSSLDSLSVHYLPDQISFRDLRLIAFYVHSCTVQMPLKLGQWHESNFHRYHHSPSTLLCVQSYLKIIVLLH